MAVVAKKQVLSELLSQNAVEMSRVESAETLIKDMICGSWNEKCRTASYITIADSKQAEFLKRIQRIYDYTDDDIFNIETQLFGEGSVDTVKEVFLDYGKFGGRFGLFATNREDGKFSVMMADYQLEFTEKPKKVTEQKATQFLKFFTRYEEQIKEKFMIDGNCREELEAFFRHRALTAFRKEGVIKTIKEK